MTNSFMIGGKYMKQQRIFLGVLLSGLGAFFLTNQYSLPYQEQVASWPSILLIIGLAFLLQSILGKETSSLFPGLILIGLGIHFHGLSLIPSWPEHWGMYTLIVGISFLLVYVRTKKEGLIPGLLLTILSIVAFLSIDPLEWLQPTHKIVLDLWPIVLICIGLFFILKRK
jgi:hypothetical protein